MYSWRENLPALQKSLAGPVLITDTPDYDDEVATFNEAVRHRPAVVVGAVNAADVREGGEVRLETRDGHCCLEHRSWTVSSGRPDNADDHDEADVES